MIFQLSDKECLKLNVLTLRINVAFFIVRATPRNKEILDPVAVDNQKISASRDLCWYVRVCTQGKCIARFTVDIFMVGV